MPELPLKLVSRRALLTGTLATTALALTACTGKPGPAASASPSASASAPRIPRTLRLAAAAPPVKLDPAIVADNESFRITRQVYETLVDIDPDTGGAVAGLAESWTESPDGLRYTFTLREGVLFHDGTELTAEAVVANFNRWENLSPQLRASSSQGFANVFHFDSDIPKLPTAKELEEEFKSAADASEEELATQQLRTKQLEELTKKFDTKLFEGKSAAGSASYFESVKATGKYLVALNLRRRLPGLIEALTLPGMAIAAPSALTGGPGQNPAESLSTHPVGTGPYTFVSHEDNVVRLEIFKDYWNQPRLSNNTAHPEVALISAVPSPYNREGALLADEIDGFDMVSVDIMRTLVRNAKVVVQRDPFSVLYLGMNQRNKWLAKPEFRMAIAHAVNRSSLAEKLFLQGSKHASTLLPSALSIPAPEDTPNHDASKAKTLLAELGYKGEQIEFAYPLQVSRNYLPLPERTFAQIAEDLAAVGIRIKPRPIAWTDGYVQTVQSKDFEGLHLLGFSGGYRSADDFLSGILAAKENEFGYTSTLLDSQIMLARSIPSGEERTAAYADILKTLNADLPALPLVFPISALAFNGNVTFYPPSPMLNECYADVQMANSPSISS
ncbi:ABC transporter substrate-binding protein [Glutamicibacter sp. NPDC087661]|uniref:ABC transporter substrate-binding protein n=1 Tax=Micrococcaceae TaxID=1268 RepID=UPI0015E2D6ED|nr:ABC transporter substrate-binding protein [Arthrobacter sp. MYb214]